MMGRSSRHDNDSRDRETATPKRRRGEEEEEEETRVLMHPRRSHVAFCMGAACFCFILISILLALPSCVYVGLVLLCVVPSMHEILNVTMVTSLSFTTTVRKLTCCSLSLPNSPQLFLAWELYGSQWGQSIYERVEFPSSQRAEYPLNLLLIQFLPAFLELLHLGAHSSQFLAHFHFNFHYF